MKRCPRAIALILAIAGSLSSCTPDLQRGWLSPTAQEVGYNVRLTPTWFYRTGIDRKEFQYIHQLGGGVDAEGYFRAPIPADQVFRDRPIRDGIFATPMRWDPGNAVMYEIRDGWVVRQDFQIRP